jgi:urease accessory protein
VSDILALVRVLQLASPVLPVGAYSYSQAVEWQVEQGDVHDAASAQDWIGGVLEHVIAVGEAPVFVQLGQALAQSDRPRFAEWNAWFRASRETHELRCETEQMGGSLARLLRDLGLVTSGDREWIDACAPITFPAAFAFAAHRNNIAPADALTAYLYAWLENQVLAAMKLVPLGQVAGQQLLQTLGARIPAVATQAMALPAEAIASFAPGLAIASARHETQHTRLFRS